MKKKHQQSNETQFEVILNRMVPLVENCGPFHPNPLINRAYIIYRILGAAPKQAQVEAFKIYNQILKKLEEDN